MKVLKNNYKEGQIAVAHESTIKPYPRKLECEKCGSELEYEESDINIGVYGAAHVLCPLCGYNNMLDGDEHDITLTKDNIEFPIHFHHTSKETGAVKISNEEIKNRIRNGVNYFRTNKDEHYWFTESGDTHVSVVRYEGDKDYEVLVTKDFYSTYIPFEEEDYE